MKRKLSERKRAENKLDAVWRGKGKEDARCEVCETLPPEERVNYGKLDPHHVIGRVNRTLRWDLRNRCWLCSTHHTLGKKSTTNDSPWFLAWFERNRPEDYKYLVAKKEILSHRTVADLEHLLEMLNKD